MLLRDEFLLDPEVTFLNHGSFGACPRVVFGRYQECKSGSSSLSRQPVLFLSHHTSSTALTLPVAELCRRANQHRWARLTALRHDERVIADRHRLIADALGQSPRTILEIDDGYDFEVAIVDDDWVFRFPRRAGVEEALALEIVLLPLLAPALPVNVPSFEHISRDPLFVGYRLIRGEPLVGEDADGVRAFLEALHALDPSRLPVQHLEWVEAYREQCAEFERLVLPLLDKDLRPQAKRLFSGAKTLVDFKPTVLHGDLGPEHLLVRDGRLAGVIDWGDARLGDPALDYAWLLNGPFADWDVDPDLRRRARFYHRLAPWYEAHYGLFTNRPAHTERGLAGIRDTL